ncbi:MAG TPA: cell wall-binding repeat-containing protein [Solirubrobacteraceae bacterium]|nr:cell wall-binding repeat-containing protein [Solirubrobacteraceae bacterium]
MRRMLLCPLIAACALFIAACGTQTKLITTPAVTIATSSVHAPVQLGFPLIATKNTTRVPGPDPIADAAGVALAVYPSEGAGTHPSVVTLAPTGDWEAALASSVLMAAPIRAPILLSGPSSLPPVTGKALTALAPSGSGASGGAQVIRVGQVPSIIGLKTMAIRGGDPFTLAAAIDRFASAAAGTASPDVIIASADDPQYAMPAAGLAAESGDPILFVNSSGVPAPTVQALISHRKPHIYVLGPASVIPDSVLAQLRKYGTVNRVAGTDPASNSVAFAKYRDPACITGQPCAHVPGSFGWAIESPGHGYILLNASRPLDAAAAAPLSASGGFGPQLLVTDPSTLPTSVVNYLVAYATPGYTAEGPTAAVYNHGWLIGDQTAISLSVQAEVDTLLEAVPVPQK